MAPTVLIVEPDHELAAALEDVVMLAHCTPLTMRTCDGLAELRQAPAAIVLRMLNAVDGPAHEELKRLPRKGRPKLVALAWSDEDAVEAERLSCDVVLRAPCQVRGLYETLVQVART